MRSVYLLDRDQVAGDAPVLDATAMRTCLADMQQVTDSSHKGTHALLTKQLHSVGCPHWRRPALARTDSTVIEIYVYTSDPGGDQVKVRAVMHAEMLRQCTLASVQLP